MLFCIPALAEKINCLSEASFDFFCYFNRAKNSFSDETRAEFNSISTDKRG